MNDQWTTTQRGQYTSFDPDPPDVEADEHRTVHERPACPVCGAPCDIIDKGTDAEGARIALDCTSCSWGKKTTVSELPRTVETRVVSTITYEWGDLVEDDDAE